jgi:hypothetical protein
MSEIKVTLPDDTASRIGLAVARKIFDSRGNHSEVHLTEGEVAVMVSAAIQLTFQKMTVSEAKADEATIDDVEKGSC